MVAGVDLIATGVAADISHLPNESIGGTVKARFVALVGKAVMGNVAGGLVARFVAVNCSVFPKVSGSATNVTVSPRNTDIALVVAGAMGLAVAGVLAGASGCAPAPLVLAIARNANSSNFI